MACFWLCNEIAGNFVPICVLWSHLKCYRCMLSSLSLCVSSSLPLSLHLSVSLALAAEGGMVMFNACGLCCTQRWRMGSSPLISNKRPLETRQAQHRSTSSKVWNDVDTDVCPGPSTVCSCMGSILPLNWVTVGTTMDTFCPTAKGSALNNEVT